ncbi:benzoate/H(+) symporter BenE family transporter [Rhodopseudomonas sp. HC1]|uniref:benzoate/H(+) symporter BenE family transporter n=1 Tax=Rhodopseudomonas infernalis TaxID=2897386 RepID=UPI001EE8C875|nr:benzoate/H(+) symporter BenE family transporter [Rhodopseudomonas infernalis]MCG6204126.1 benzoate/H(+) symporter BenE family transporter [Rhodopseudomonas infernalis]
MRDFSVSAVVAGLIAVIISYAGPLVIVFQAANAAQLPPEVVSSWIGAISIGSGVAAIVMSLIYRAPCITAWSTPGAALLVLALPSIPYAQAIGAFVFAAAVCTFLGLSGLFDTVVSRIPKGIAAAMLAGILFRFGADIFGAFSADPIGVGLMVSVYLIAKRTIPRYAITAVLCTGLAIAFAAGEIHTAELSLEFAKPVFTAPEFSWQSILSLGVPLALVTLTGQFVPGIAVLRTFGYKTPANPLVWITSAISLVIAPFGSHGINLAAITAAICSGPEAHPDPRKRYVAGVALGVFYIIAGIFGATLVTIFAALPKTMIATLAGLALLGAIASGLTAAMAEEKVRESALITFLVTASGTSFLGLGSAFWGLIVGLIAYLVWSVWLISTTRAQLAPAKD